MVMDTTLSDPLVGRLLEGRYAVEAFIAHYYAALNDRRFGDAWKLLSPAVQTHLGTFATWQARKTIRRRLTRGLDRAS